MNSNKYVALDVHCASIVAKVHNDAGNYVMESILETRAGGIIPYPGTAGEFFNSVSEDEISGTVNLIFNWASGLFK